MKHDMKSQRIKKKLDGPSFPKQENALIDQRM